MQFQLRVIRAESSPELIQLEAASDQQARQIAVKQGFTVLNVQRKGRKRSAKRFPLLLFCQELRVLLDAGLNLNESLETLAQKETHVENKAIINQLVQAIQNGQPFSDALAMTPDCFPGLFVASVRACETTGNLTEGLQRYSLYLEQIDILRNKIVSASIYPSIVLAFGGLVLAFLLGYVVPRFSKIYESRSAELSLPSEILMVIGQTVDRHGLILLITMAILLLLLAILLSQSSIQGKIMALIARLPKLGERIRMYHLSRFYRTLSMLLRSGIAVVPSLSLISELLGETLKPNVEQTKQLVTDGQSFTKAMQMTGLTTPVAERLFNVGEKSGRLDTMMEQAANFHEDEMLRFVDAFTKVFEPILMALIGLVIGVIVLLMYLPIFELASGIQ